MADQTKTAPVDEYRVLWTTNKTQKIKKWHDGFLRYHSFNRRMLVYDNGRHLVADMYLRDREFLGEGDELEFEHHLVSIEDFTGSVNQDLTPIFSPALQRKQAAASVASAAQTPIPDRRREPTGVLRGVQSARQQRPAARGSYTPTPVRRESRNGLGNEHITTPSRPTQAPATVPRMNGQGKSNGVMGLNTPGRRDYLPIAGPGRSRVSGHVGMDTSGPQVRVSMPVYMGNGQVKGSMDINTPVRNSTSHNSYLARQHAVYPPQANERPINFRQTESLTPQRAPPPTPPQPVPCRQNPTSRPVGRPPPPVTKEVAHANAQLSTHRPPPPQRPQHQQRNGVLEGGRPATAGRQIPAQINRSGDVTRISPPLLQGRPRSQADRDHLIPQQIEPPAQQRYNPPAPQPRGCPPPVPPRAPGPVPAQPPAPAQAPSDELAFGAPAAVSKIRQFSAPSRARPPRQPTAPSLLPQRSPGSIQVPSSAAESPPHIPRSPSPHNRLPPPPLLQKEAPIPNSRSPSPARNPTIRPPKRPSTNIDANQPPTKRKTQFQSARRLAEQEEDEIHDVDDSDDDNNVTGPIRQGAGVIKLSSTSGPKKMLLCARPPTFKFPPKQPEKGVKGNKNENRERPKTLIDEEDYGEWDEDDEIMSLY